MPKTNDLFSFGRSLRTPIETPSFAPSVAWFGETRAREIGVDLTGNARTSSKELPALMCGDRNLSRRGVERVHFQLRLEPGFYRFDFGFLTLLRKRIVKGDNCKYPLPSRDWRGKMYPYDGRMKEANARRYFREHAGQLDSEHPEATLGFQEIDEMDHQPDYARIEVLLGGKLIGFFNLSSPIYVESKNNTFKPHVYGRTFAIDEPREYTLTLQAVTGKAGFIGNPFFVHIFVQARHDAHHFRALRIYTNVRANCIHHINGFRLFQLPRPHVEGVRVGRQGTNRTKINHIAGKFGRKGLFNIGADFHMLAATGCPHFRNPGDFAGKTNATGTMNAAGHHGPDQGTEGLVFD